VPRRGIWIALVVAVLTLMGGVGFIVGASAPPLRPIALIAIVAMAVGLVAGAPWLITVACGVTVVEIGLAFTAGSIADGWIGALAVGVFLAVEAAVAALEAAGDVVAPREPIAHVLMATIAKAAVVWSAASVVALVAGSTDRPGTLARIAGVAAAAAVLATLTRLVERQAQTGASLDARSHHGSNDMSL
jgi:hypothetical protein